MDPIVLVLKVAFALYLLTLSGASAFVWIAYRRDPYPPEAAEAPSLDEHFKTAPKDDLAVDWHRYEYEMRKQT